MKHLIFSAITLFLVHFSSVGQDLSPYVKVGESTLSMQEILDKVIQNLKDNSFTVLGTYNPSNKNTLKVIAFTKNDLKNTVIKVKDRGALAAIMKVGLVMKGDKVIISYTNPDYILRAYLGANYNTFSGIFKTFSSDLKSSLNTIGSDFNSFNSPILHTDENIHNQIYYLKQDSTNEELLYMKRENIYPPTISLSRCNRPSHTSACVASCQSLTICSIFVFFFILNRGSGCITIFVFAPLNLCHSSQLIIDIFYYTQIRLFDLLLRK